MKLYAAILVFCAALSSVSGETFSYKQKKGDMWRIAASVEEEVYVNGQLSHKSVIATRTACEVEEETPRGAVIKAVFESAEEAQNPDGSGRFVWDASYESTFTRSSSGRILIDKNYFKPSVRSVPFFPNKNIEAGDSWQEGAVEAFDMRQGFGIPAPYTVPFTAHYKYLGQREWDGVMRDAFSVDWQLEYKPPASVDKNNPVRVKEAAHQTIYWNREAGREAGAEEEFSLEFIFADGASFEFRGRGSSTVLETEALDRDAAQKEALREIEKLGIENTSVEKTDAGIVLTLEDIQFEPDSGRLLPSEKAKLDKIALIISKFQGRDLLITGHTALSGTKEGRDKLSLERADAVGAYLLGTGALQDNGAQGRSVITRGYGAEKPVAPNDTEEGRSRNRRVEITILEN